MGSVEFWVRLKVPVTESVHLHRERMKAVDYVSSSQVLLLHLSLNMTLL